MSSYHDHGPLREYEITWTSGRIETVQAHQVTWPPAFLSSFFGDTKQRHKERVMLHGEFDGHWQLVLAARPEDITSIRNLFAAPESL